MKTWNALMHELCAQPPSRWLLSRKEDGWLEEYLPEVHVLFGVPQPKEYHPEIDSGVHTMLVVDQAWMLSNANHAVVWAAMLHDLGKGITPPDEWPKHHDHEEKGLPLVAKVNVRFDAPSYAQRLSRLVCSEHLNAHRCLDMRPGKIIQWLHNTGMLNDPQLLHEFVVCCEADARGRAGLEHRQYLSPLFLKEVVTICHNFLTPDEPLQQVPLQNAISALKKHFAPYGKQSIQEKLGAVYEDVRPMQL